MKNEFIEVKLVYDKDAFNGERTRIEMLLNPDNNRLTIKYKDGYRYSDDSINCGFDKRYIGGSVEVETTSISNSKRDKKTESILYNKLVEKIDKFIETRQDEFEKSKIKIKKAKILKSKTPSNYNKLVRGPKFERIMNDL